MAQESDLFGKTFDQQVKATRGKIAGKNIHPNSLLQTEVVLEPVPNGIRVTARDDQHRILWGFIASKGTLSQVHCPVAVYETLQETLIEALKRHSLPVDEDKNPVEAAQVALDELKGRIEELRKTITVLKESEATRKRAQILKRIARDTMRSINLESASL